MIGKLIIISVLASALFGVGLAGMAHADPATPIPFPPNNAQVALPPTCEYVNGSVDCVVERTYGIKRIKAHIATGVGQVEVFDETYKGCPTTVEFSLDPIVLDYDTSFDIETCDVPESVGSQPDNGSFKARPAPPEVIGGLRIAP